MKRQAPEPLNESEIKALKDIIRESKNVTQRAKQVLLWLIEQSQGLIRPVQIISPRDDALGKEVSYGSHNMCSWGGIHPERLNAVMLGMQFGRSKAMSFSHGSIGLGKRKEDGYGFYVALCWYGGDGKEVELLPWIPEEFAKVQ